MSYCFNDFVLFSGGSLDVYKKIPEHVLGRIAVAVSFHKALRTCPFIVWLKTSFGQIS